MLRGVQDLKVRKYDFEIIVYLPVGQLVGRVLRRGGLGANEYAYFTAKRHPKI